MRSGVDFGGAWWRSCVRFAALSGVDVLAYCRAAAAFDLLHYRVRTCWRIVVQLAETSMPLCMRNLAQKLKEVHHLRHAGRIQYGLFLKGIGLGLEEALVYWAGEFSKVRRPRTGARPREQRLLLCRQVYLYTTCLLGTRRVVFLVV